MSPEERTTMIGCLGCLSIPGLVLVFAVIGSMTSPTSDSRTSQESEQGSKSRSPSDSDREFAWTEKGKEAVRAKLKDPSSAEFRNVFFHRGKDNIPLTCGEVNSKNGFGGMTGYQRFISGGPTGPTFLEEEVSDDFTASWNRFCVE